ncbi:hypothetical protein NMY22_g4915 [Coprinellus aureogranulatus]|nr:hypothetical protein NMY22_g4915 [Coprinellus aureogranulatus]
MATRDWEAQGEPDEGEHIYHEPTISGRKGRRRKDLSFLPEVPMDVLLEILVLLDPKDLITMSRANKDFRKALVNETMNRVVWKVKREESGAPAPPPRWSEAKWVTFLFNSFCYSCATPNVVTDFYILKRLCVSCKKQNYLADEDVDPDYAGLLDFVPRTCCKAIWFSSHQAVSSEALVTVGPSSSKEVANDVYCWVPDFENVINKFDSACDLVENGDSEARVALELFKKDQFDLIEWINKTADECYSWVEALHEQKQLDKASINERRAQIIRVHFYELGYEQVDVDQVVLSTIPEVSGKTAKITKRVWNNIRAKLEPEVIEAREARLYGIKCELFNARTAIFAPLWLAWKDSLNLSTSEDLTYPPDWYFSRLPAVLDIMHSEGDVTVETFAPMIPDFPNMVKEFQALKKAELREMIPATNVTPNSPDALELATSVFRPPYHCERAYGEFDSEGVVIGWKQHSVIHGWRNVWEYGWETRAIAFGRFDPNLSKIAAFLVELCGLDPFTTTAEDMDRVDMRFMCRECLNEELREEYGYRVDLDGEIPRTELFMKAYTWRAALSHMTIHFGRGGDRPFKLLDEPKYLEDAKAAEAHARPRILARLPAWFCNHCRNMAGGDSVTKCGIFRHVELDHGIEDPQENVDYVFNEVYRTKVEEPRSIDVCYERTRVFA